ncbi:MraZ protein [Neisseria perflava]|nr:MraZ protein [Neisseria perflava]
MTHEVKFLIVSAGGVMWAKVSDFPKKRKFQTAEKTVFGGAHELSIDSKGRLAIPAKFRDLLLRRYTPVVVATLDSRQRILMYPESEWEKVANQLLGMKTAGKPELQRFQNLLLHNADTLEWDTAGRILLPANLRRLVDFEKEVTLVGRANRLELWGREHWEREMNQALDDDPDELAFQLSQTDLQL